MSAVLLADSIGISFSGRPVLRAGKAYPLPSVGEAPRPVSDGLVDPQTEADILKVQMQNESKEMIASMNNVVKAIMEAQKASEQRMMAIEQAIPDMNPVMEALQAVQMQVQEQIQAMQPVGIKQIRDESGRLVGGVRVLADGTEQEITIQ